MKLIAHCMHHTHWDLIWYFTTQDATVQFAYNMKELLNAYRNKRVKRFLMDGQTAPITEYLELHPEDKDYIKELVTEGKLIIGPLQSQLDCFICNGESVVNNLRLGLKASKELGKTSDFVYLPDSFGHSYDFPKIFNSFDIHNFVITRGVGDDYKLGSEFYLESNDGSKVLTCAMIAGYGYGCYPFKDGSLFGDKAVDYNKISVRDLINRLVKYSTIDNEFVFPLGFDQNPAMMDIDERIEKYNSEQKEIEFRETTWSDFCDRVREKGVDVKTHNGELFSTQYHRVHRSIFSARADIKALQDCCEREITYQLQPLMSMLDSLGIKYEHSIVDKSWDTLLRCQTHSSATLTDETNNYIERETRNALNLVESQITFLMKLVSLALDIKNDIVVCHTLPIKEKKIMRTRILTKEPEFSIYDENGKEIEFTVLKSLRKNNGVYRKDIELINNDKFYYDTEILLETNELDGICYKVYSVVEGHCGMHNVVDGTRFIENQRYRIYLTDNGLNVIDKITKSKKENLIWLEDMGDEGDSFDYSYPTFDHKVTDDLSGASVRYYQTEQKEWMTLDGNIQIPKNLNSRKNHKCDITNAYHIEIALEKGSDRIDFSGYISNKAEQHRMRFIIKGDEKQEHSYAGTQYGMIERVTRSKEMDTWKRDKWFEEPSATYPLLNHVTRIESNNITSVFTRSVKEYEFVNEGFKDIAITLFRSYGAMGYPDLNRRPGRPGGLDYMIIESPECQMLKDNYFEFSIMYSNEFDENKITNEYIKYATDGLIFQSQEFDKFIKPITYFPTNKPELDLPKSYKFISLEDSDASFGSVVKSDTSDEYLIRLYNNKTSSIPGGKLSGKFKELHQTNLNETIRTSIYENIDDFNKGELRIISFK